MSFNRRHFMGALGAGSVSMGIPRSTPWPTLPLINPGLRPVLAPLPASVAAIPVAADSARPALVSRALAALDTHSARVTNRGVMGVVDFSAASHVARLHFVDIDSGRIIAEHLVAHGHGYAVLSLNAIRNDPLRARLLPRPIVKPKLVTSLAIATPSQRPLTPLAQQVVALVRELAPRELMAKTG